MLLLIALILVVLWIGGLGVVPPGAGHVPRLLVIPRPPRIGPDWPCRRRDG